MANRVFKLRSGKVVDERVNQEIVPAERIEW
jgi:putative ABC transport system ATP-binding protein